MSAQQAQPWKAAIWDRPSNGTRYYVCRGEEAAGTRDGGVYTFRTREDARKYAEQLNRQSAAVRENAE